MKKFKLALPIMLIFTLLAAFSVFAEEAPEGSTTITILHTNDMHGRLFQSGSAIGLDTVAGIYAATPNSILVDAGDTIHGLPFVTFNRGVNAIKLMNAAGYSFMAPGNHDFNYGAEHLRDLAAQLADFEILAANITDAAGRSLFRQYAIVEIDGVSLGFFGLAYPGTPSTTNPDGVVGLYFGNPVEAAAGAVESLQAAGADVVIAIAHLGIEGDAWVFDVASEVAGIHVILDGHSHTVLEEGYRMGDTLIAQAGGHGEFLGVVEIIVYDGEVLSTTASLIDREASEAFTPVAEVTALIAEMQEELGGVLDTVVANSPITLFGDDPDHRPALRSSEVPIGNLIADSMVWAMDADIAIMNSGSIRYHIHEGDVTKGDIITVLAFFNYAVVVEITAAQLWEAIEIGVSALGHGRFPQVSGFTYIFDPEAEPGSRVISITVDGTPISSNDTTTTFSLVINDFVVAGGDDFTVFVGLPVLREGGTLDELLIDFMEQFDISGYTAPEGRILAAPNGYVSIRAFAEAFGADVQWNRAAQTVTLTLGGEAYTHTIGYRGSFLDAELGRIFIPIDYAVEIFS